MIVTECIETPTATEGLFVYEIVKEVCTHLKPGVSGGFDQVTYKTLEIWRPKVVEYFVNTLLPYVLIFLLQYVTEVPPVFKI